jgi:peptidyl-prolyl cis-trans isomerase A (cyclophilin A)
MKGSEPVRKSVALLLSFVSACAFADAENVEIIMSTTEGNIVIELEMQSAPITANNFLTLVDGGHLDGATFYRTVSPENDNGTAPISVIQGGLGDASEAYQTVAHETTDKTGILHSNGSVSMARSAPGTASTEFFICIGDQPALDFGGKRNTDQLGFAAFGRVVGGMDVVKAIHDSPSDTPVDDDYFKGQILENPVLIQRVTRKIPPHSTH